MTCVWTVRPAPHLLPGRRDSPFPFGYEKGGEVVGAPIWGASAGIEDNLHFCDVLQGDAPRVDDGRFDRDPRPVRLASGKHFLLQEITLSEEL
jgi:hypothetical protein